MNTRNLLILVVTMTIIGIVEYLCGVPYWYAMPIGLVIGFISGFIIPIKKA